MEDACIVTQEEGIDPLAADQIGRAVCARFPRSEVHMQKIGTRYLIEVHHDRKNESITLLELSDLESTLDEIKPPPRPRRPPPPPPKQEEEKDEDTYDPNKFNVYLGVIYGGTTDMRPSAGGSVGFSVGESDVSLHTEARFMGNPAHLWPFATSAATPTRVSGEHGIDAFAVATTFRAHFSPHSDIGLIMGAGLGVEEIGQANYLRSGIVGVFEIGAEIFHTKHVGMETILHCDLPGFSVRTGDGPSHAPVLTAGMALRF